jgi:hypothetical protein
MKYSFVSSVLSIMLFCSLLFGQEQNVPAKKLSVREQLEQLNASAQPASAPLPEKPVVRKAKKTDAAKPAAVTPMVTTVPGAKE